MPLIEPIWIFFQTKLSKVIETTVVRDYDNGGKLVTIDGHDRYVRYHTTQNQDDGSTVEGFDVIWLDVAGNVIRVNTHDGINYEYPSP